MWVLVFVTVFILVQSFSSVWINLVVGSVLLTGTTPKSSWVVWECTLRF